MDSTKLTPIIDDALAKAGVVSTGWVIVVAVIDDDSSEWLLCESSEGLTDWTRTGMLDEALDSEDWDDDEEPQ